MPDVSSFVNVPASAFRSLRVSKVKYGLDLQQNTVCVPFPVVHGNYYSG